jgi:GDPmannose 4,6-dehydratase
MARVLVTGVTGQVGSYLADQLLAGGHEIVGVVSPSGRALPAGVRPAAGSLDEPAALLDSNGALDAVVHLAARSSVAASWLDPMATFDLNGRRAAGLAFAAGARGLRFVHASSAEIFGRGGSGAQSEDTPVRPVSPYGVAKAAAHLAVQVAREGLGAPASNLIFFLGESPRRSAEFVFRKITSGVAAIAAGRASELRLGNTEVVRDFSHARDLAAAAHLLALGAPAGDYVCASGEGHRVLDVALVACRLAGVDPGVVRSDPALFRTNDIPSLVGDSGRLRAIGWRSSASFEEIVREVLEYDLRALAADGATIARETPS